MGRVSAGRGSRKRAQGVEHEGLRGKGAEITRRGGMGGFRWEGEEEISRQGRGHKGKSCAAAGQPRRDGRLPLAPRGVTGVSC